MSIREMREKAKITQKTVSEYLGMTQGAVSLMELGKRQLTLSTARKLAKLYGHTIDEIAEAAEQDDEPGREVHRNAQRPAAAQGGG